MTIESEGDFHNQFGGVNQERFLLVIVDLKEQLECSQIEVANGARLWRKFSLLPEGSKEV
jgi:hypothetical protein